jgi:4-hydroxybenzoyl-CoA reductase subunit beta
VLRLPRLRYLVPERAREASDMQAEYGAKAMLVAGGTDLFPNLKRRQFEPEVLIGLSHLKELNLVEGDPSSGFEIGACVTLSRAAAHPALSAAFPGYSEAAGLVSSPPLRNAGTIGGNLCVDTRCNYYNQSFEWRESIGFCMKKDGVICLVAPGSSRCWAVSSSDTAPMAIALGATVVLAGPDGDRELPVSALYRDDGIDYLAKQPHEVVTKLRLPPPGPVRSAYVKIRRRGSIDFPIAGAAVALTLDGRVVEKARIVLSAVGSQPLEARAAEAFLTGRELTVETMNEAGEIAAKPAKPLDNTDLNYVWRKRMVGVAVTNALQKILSSLAA